MGAPVPVPTMERLAEVHMGGCCADGAAVTAGGAGGDEVNQGPLSGQGTHGAAPSVAVHKGEVQPVSAGQADGTLWAVERAKGEL